MLRKLLLVMSVISLSCYCFAQEFFKLPPEDATPLLEMSWNGMYACYSLEGTAYMYDLAAKKMTILEGAYDVSAVSDNGVFVGSEIVEKKYIPSYYKDEECINLPLPEGYTTGMARGINANASVIVGRLQTTPFVPCVWTLQTDGSYLPQLLPTYDKDFTDRVPQGIEPVYCSVDGNAIVGRMIDHRGDYCIFLSWTKTDAGSWELKEWGKDILFKEGAVLPSFPPDPVKPDAMDYFTAADLATYNKALEDYTAGNLSEDPEQYKQNYITNPDSIDKYNEAAKEYNAIHEIIIQKTKELFECSSGIELDVYSMRMSGNGKYLSATYTYYVWEEGSVVPIEINTPICLDLVTGNWNIKEDIKNGIAGGVTDNGDFFYATPYRAPLRNSFVIPFGSKDRISVAEWVKQKTNGIVDLSSHFTFSYMNPQTGENVTDSVVVGNVFPSADGSVLMGTFFSPVAPEFVTWFVNMNDPESIENANDGNGSINVYPNPATDIIYVNGNADHVTISDLSGRTLYESSITSGCVPVNMLNEGIYLVKVNTDGKTTTQKIVVKK